jgi:hypothetical protein
LSEVLHEVEDKGVVVIDDQDLRFCASHALILS